jgi:hypothetical protein
MARSTIVAQFNEYAAAHRALCELIQIGIQPNCISIIAGDRSNSQGNRDLGIIEKDAERYCQAVRHGRTILAVEADEAARTQVLESIEHHKPTEIEEVAAAE